MATVNPPLGAVAPGSHLGTFATDPDTVVVGSPPQWSDNSDATYAYLHLSGSFGGAAYARTDPITEGTITGCTVTVRAKAEPGDGGPDATFTVFPGRTPVASFHTLFNIDLSIPDDGAVHEVSGHKDYGPELIAVQTDWATVGFHVEVGNGAVPVFIYEVDIVLTLADTTKPATRLFPRDDALGLGSAPRIHPLPKSGRLVGGHH